jgi:putative membrane protein
MLDRVLRLVCTALAVFLVTLLPWLGISFAEGTSTWQKVLTALVMALVLGVVNALLKPLIKLLGLPLYLLTLGLISLVVNGFLFWLSGVIVRAAFDLQFNVPFWPGAILGALFVTIVSVILGWVIKDYSK